MQQIVHYNHNICFSHMGEEGEQYYEPKYFINRAAFDLAPMEDVVVVLGSCGGNWFRQGISHDLVIKNGRWEFSQSVPKQLCLYIRNYSDQARIHVEQGTELSSLLNQHEILFKVAAIPIDFFNRGPSSTDAGWTSNAEQNIDEEEEEEEEKQSVYYVKIFKKQ